MAPAPTHGGASSTCVDAIATLLTITTCRARRRRRGGLLPIEFSARQKRTTSPRMIGSFVALLGQRRQVIAARGRLVATARTSRQDPAPPRVGVQPDIFEKQLDNRHGTVMVIRPKAPRRDESDKFIPYNGLRKSKSNISINKCGFARPILSRESIAKPAWRGQKAGSAANKKLPGQAFPRSAARRGEPRMTTQLRARLAATRSGARAAGAGKAVTSGESASPFASRLRNFA